MKYTAVFLLLCVSVTAQERTHRFRLMTMKYLVREVTCARLSIQDIRPESVRQELKYVYADNRDGMKRIIVLPDQQATYFFDGSRVTAVWDFQRQYRIFEGESALYVMRTHLDNISTALLARRMPQDDPQEAGSAGDEESADWLGDRVRRIIVRYPDDRANQLTEIRQELHFHDRTEDLLLDRQSNLFLGDTFATQVRLDTVYADTKEIDSLLADIRDKLSRYTLSEASEPENGEAVYDHARINAQLDVIRPAPKGSRYYLFDFFFVQCPPCLKGVPILKRLHADYAPDILSIMAINDIDSREKIDRYLEAYDPPYGMAMLDKDFVNREIGQIVHPTFVLFDSDGNVVWHATGFTDTLEAEIRTVLEK